MATISITNCQHLTLIVYAVMVMFAVTLCSNLAFAENRSIINRSQPNLEGVKVVEKLGKNVPLEVSLKDEYDNAVLLKDYFVKGRPVLITMNYASCPMLCSLQLQGLTQAMQKMDKIAGDDFILVSISYDPEETAQQALGIKERYLSDYGLSTSNSAWNFLRGDSKTLQLIADQLGIHYKYIQSTKEYSHPATVVVCTPEGKISKYIHGVSFESKEIDRNLADAKLELISTKNANGILPLFCSVFDENAGVYVVSAMRIMQFSAICFALAVGSLIYACHKMVKAKEQTEESNKTKEIAAITGHPESAH